MKKLLKFILLIFITIYITVIFIPKKELFFLAELYLEKEKIVLSNETHSDYGLIFKISNGALYYDRLKAFDLSSITFLPLVVYNQISLDPIELEGALATVMPKDISYLKAYHTVFLPHIVFVKAEGGFGTLSGKIDLFNRTVDLMVDTPKVVENQYRALFAQMKRGENGFVYQSNF